MSYTDDAEILATKLEAAGLLGLTGQMRDGSLIKPHIVEASSIQEKNRFKFLIYSFLRLNGLTKTYHVKWESPLALRIVPDINKAKMHEAAAAMRQEQEVPAGYITPDMSFLDMNDKEVVEAAVGDKEKL